ncbi:MAG TPA: response regulator transcription factor, partial [Terracidiphilus sp.]
MIKIILADSQAIFRAGTAKVLAADDDMRIIAQCADLDRLLHAVATFPGTVVLFASTLKPEMTGLRKSLEDVGSRGVVIVENNEAAAPYVQLGFKGVVFRSVTGQALVDCVRRVAAGDTWIPPQLVVSESHDDDVVGRRVRDRLTPKEMRIVALIVQGCKNREIASRLKTTEQVIKNYLRSIYDKTGVSDRLELALFTIH